MRAHVINILTKHKEASRKFINEDTEQQPQLMMLDISLLCTRILRHY